MKVLIAVFSLVFSISVLGAVPTEEGLLKNLNNAGIPGNLITIKGMVQNSSLAVGTVADTEGPKADFYKFVLSLENPNVVSLFQVIYSNGQMQNNQIREVKYIPDLLLAIKREKSPEKGMFYAILMMLTTNNSLGVEAFLEKGGIQIVRNKDILNEDKMRLLRTYRTYLTKQKGKGDANSPLNPTDPQNKAKVLELFRANTFLRSKNIELVKIDNEFLWKADWKSAKGYFTNEERRLRVMEYATGDVSIKLEAQDYILFNGTNELPKFISFKDSKGQTAKMQILGLDTITNKEKKLSERYEDARKNVPANNNGETSYSFLF